MLDEQQTPVDEALFVSACNMVLHFGTLSVEELAHKLARPEPEVKAIWEVMLRRKVLVIPEPGLMAEPADVEVIMRRRDAAMTAGDKPLFDDMPKTEGKTLKPDPEFDAAQESSYRVAANELRSFIERIERLHAEKADIADQVKEVRAEAKARGYMLKAIDILIAERKRDRDDVAEEQAIVELYKSALGM